MIFGVFWPTLTMTSSKAGPWNKSTKKSTNIIEHALVLGEEGRVGGLEVAERLLQRALAEGLQGTMECVIEKFYMLSYISYDDTVCTFLWVIVNFSSDLNPVWTAISWQDKCLHSSCYKRNSFNTRLWLSESRHSLPHEMPEKWKSSPTWSTPCTPPSVSSRPSRTLSASGMHLLFIFI